MINALCRQTRDGNKYTCRIVSNYQLNAQFLYSITIYMLHYNPRHVSSSTMLIFRRSNCIITVSGIVTLCKRPYSMPVESGLSPLSTGILFYCYRIKELCIKLVIWNKSILWCAVRKTSKYMQKYNIFEAFVFEVLVFQHCVVWQGSKQVMEKQSPSARRQHILMTLRSKSTTLNGVKTQKIETKTFITLHSTRMLSTVNHAT